MGRMFATDNLCVGVGDNLLRLWLFRFLAHCLAWSQGTTGRHNIHHSIVRPI